MPDEHARTTREEPLTPDDTRAPTHGERARTLLASLSTGTLCTLSPDGYPHGSYVTFALQEGDPVFLVSTLATHTKQLMRDPRSSLMAHEATHPDPLANGRVTLLGRCAKLDAPAEAREAYLAAHPGAAYYADFKDFAFWKLAVEQVRYIGGYGRMSWVEIDDWRGAAPDPLAPHVRGIVDHMNEDHADACVAYARAFTRARDASEAEMTGIDRYGFELSVATERGPRPARIAFEQEITTPEQARKALVKLVHAARAALG
jgi:heme iron utilization protein